MRTRVRHAEEAAVDVRFCLVFPREALSVPVMRHVLGDTLRDLGADDEGVADLLLAVTEACTNVVQHGGLLGMSYPSTHPLLSPASSVSLACYLPSPSAPQ